MVGRSLAASSLLLREKRMPPEKENDLGGGHEHPCSKSNTSIINSSSMQDLVPLKT